MGIRIKHITTSIAINISIDGLPIFKSSKSEFWPILFNIYGTRATPKIFGLYLGNGKPKKVKERNHLSMK